LLVLTPVFRKVQQSSHNKVGRLVSRRCRFGR
jgi:hypothetical protein